MQLNILADNIEQYYEKLEGRMGFQHKKFAADVDINGEEEGNAYTVLECMEKNGHKYVALQNPWGNTERIYTRVTKPGKKGQPPIIEYEEEAVNIQSGQFYMELNDLINSTVSFYGIS